MAPTADQLTSALPAVFDALDRAGIAYAVFGRPGEPIEKLYLSPVAAEQLGYTADEWLAKPMFEIIAPQERERSAALYERMFSNEPVPAAIEITFLTKNGTVMPIELTLGRAETAMGRVLVLMWSRESVLHPSQLSLLEADRVSLVGALAAGFAHETNNPLTSVLLNLRSLRKQLVTNLTDTKQSAALRILDDITTGAERIASNVRAFQTLASRSSTQPVDLAAVASAVLRLALPTLEPRAHVIRQIYPVRPVAGEESRIGQAVLAMLLFACSGFAVDAVDANNRITVSVDERDQWVIVEVSDNGRELAPDEVGRAFDPFFRSAVRGAGFGVGLGVARSVATTLGGDVALAPRPGGGAVITMRLPPAPAE